MGSLSEDRTPGFDKYSFVPGDPCQIKCQKGIAIIRHRMAIQRALDLIEARMKDIPTLSDLASLSGLSRTYFSRVFREVVGMRLMDYIIQARINKAKDLLRDINLEIKEIAHEVGFRDPNHFSRTFKRKTGVSPTEWRVKKS